MCIRFETETTGAKLAGSIGAVIVPLFPSNKLVGFFEQKSQVYQQASPVFWLI